MYGTNRWKIRSLKLQRPMKCKFNKTFYHKKWWSPIDIIFIKQSWRLVRGRMRPINQWHARIVTSRLARDHAWLCGNRRDLSDLVLTNQQSLKGLTTKSTFVDMIFWKKTPHYQIMENSERDTCMKELWTQSNFKRNVQWRIQDFL